MYNKELKMSLMIKITQKVNLTYQCQQEMEELINNVLEEYQINKRELIVASDIQDKIMIYLNTKRLEGTREKTLKNYFNILKKLVGCFPNKTVKELELNDLRMFLAKECEGLKPSTINTKTSYIRNFFSWLLDEGYVDRDCSKKLARPRVPKRLRKALTLEEVELLRISCTNGRERALIEFLLATGCRISEVKNVNVSDINFDHNSLRVTGKGNVERLVFFSDKTKVYLKQYIESRNVEEDALFIADRKPYARLGDRALQKTIDRITSRSGIDKSVYPHLFRHTFATMGLQRGASLPSIQKLLGHSSVSTTEKYAATSVENVRYDYDHYMIQ